MIDTQAVVQQASLGMAPPSWQVLRAKRSFFISSAIGGVVFTIGALAAAIYLFVSGAIVGIGVSDQTPSNVAIFWFIVDMVALAAAAIGGVIFALGSLRGLSTADEQMLVLMPEGFVLRRGAAENKTTTVNFQRVATVTPSVQSGRVFLIMQIVGSGQRAKVELDNRFGPAKRLAQQIAGMHAHYVTTHQQTSRG
jgi:uncharacterized membrane protein